MIDRGDFAGMIRGKIAPHFHRCTELRCAYVAMVDHVLDRFDQDSSLVGLDFGHRPVRAEQYRFERAHSGGIQIDDGHDLSEHVVPAKLGVGAQSRR